MIMPKTAPHRLLLFPERIYGDQSWINDTIKSLQEGVSAEVFCHEGDRSIIDGIERKSIQTYGDGHLTGAREDLSHHRAIFSRWVDSDVCLIRPPTSRGGYEAYHTYVRLMGRSRFEEISETGARHIEVPPYNPQKRTDSVLVKACGGIGNIILVTPLLRAALDAGMRVTFCPSYDSNDTIDLLHLFEGCAEGIELVAPEELENRSADVVVNIEDRKHIAPGDFFHSPYHVGTDGSEARLYATFFGNVTGLDVDVSRTFVGGRDTVIADELWNRIVVCPGSKVGWDSKRWPHMNDLIQSLDDPVVLCRQEDLEAYERLPFLRAINAGNATYVTDFDLNQIAALFRKSRAVVANDCGLGHIAAAAGAKTVTIFGPSSPLKNLHSRSNVNRVSLHLPCQPCQGRKTGPGRLEPYDYDCQLGYTCLAGLKVEDVLSALEDMLRSNRPMLEIR